MRKKKIKQVITMCKEKGTRRFKFDDVSYFYKTICVSQLGKRFEIFDTSTDIYRPLTDEEVDNLIELGLDKFTNKLSIKNTLDSIALNRNMFHIAIAKGSQKEKDFFFRKTMRRIKKLRNLLGYKQKIA